MFGKIKSGRTKSSREKIQKSVKKARELSDYSNVAADEQQQAKVVLYFMNGRKVAAIPEGRAEVSEAGREKIIDELKSGKITTAEIEKFLSQVTMPLVESGAKMGEIFREIVKSPKQKQILAVATGHDVRNWQTVDEADLRNLLDKPLKGQIDYRTPVGFAKFRESFLEGIEAQASSEQMVEYNRAMDALEEKIYGRRFDYYRQIRLMMGSEKVALMAMVEEPLNEPVVVDELAEIITEEKPAGVTTVVAATMNTVTPERSEQILAATVITGDAWQQDGNEYNLNTASLTNGGVTPAYEVNVNGFSVALSVPFQLSDGRGAILGYAATSEGWKLRSYYLNPRTGMWYFAPDIIRGPRGEGMAQITEGYGAASTILPSVLQQKLTEIVKANGFREITTVNADFLFAGSCAAYNSLQEWREALSRRQMRNDFYTQVDAEPVSMNWQPSGRNKNVPQLLSVNAEVAPNFQVKVAGFQTYSILAGQVMVESFAANDGEANWVFCSDDWHRTWIANIEMVSSITSVGCYKTWMQAGDMVTPLYEYSTQAGSYGDAADTRKGVVGMWNYYLSKIPVIQGYLGRKRG